MMDRSDVPIDAKAALARVPLGARRTTCPFHGDFEEQGFRFAGVKREIWSGCAQCRAAADRERVAEAQRDAQLRLERRRADALGQACIPARFRDRTFEAFTTDTAEQQRVFTAVRDFVEQFETNSAAGRGLILSGSPGTGKTHLAAAAMLKLLDQQRWVQYLTCMSLIRMIRETWRRDSDRTELEVLKLLGERIELLVIDEIGVQYGTDGEKTVLFEILDRRYSELRPTILITNQNKQGFQSFVGDRVFDRLRQTHDWVPFDWQSYRVQARKEEISMMTMNASRGDQ